MFFFHVNDVEQTAGPVLSLSSLLFRDEPVGKDVVRLNGFISAH